MVDRQTGAELAGVRSGACGLRRLARFVAAGMGLATVGTAFLLATLTPAGAGVRLPAALLLVTGLAGLVVVLYRVGRKARTELSLDALTPEAEIATGLCDGELRAALELGPAKPGESEELVIAHRQSVSSRVSGRSPSELFPGSSARWRRAAVIGTVAASTAIGLVVLSALVRPVPTAQAARLWVAPWRALASVPVSELRVLAPASVPRGEAVALRISAQGRSRVILFQHATGEPPRSRELSVDPFSGVAEVRSEPIRARTRLWAEDRAGRASEIVEVSPMDPLLLRELALKLSYPAYLGRPSERLDRPFSIVAIPEGTTVHAWGSANGPLSAVTLAPPGDRAGDSAVSFAVDGEDFDGSFRPWLSGEWRWGIIAAGRTTGLVLPPALEIRVLRDGPADVRILDPEGDRALGSKLRLPVVVDVRDDIGISDVELVSWKVSAVGAGLPVARSIAPPEPASRMILRGVLRGDEHELLPGDTLYYFVRARDAHPGHAPASSDTLRAFLPTLRELREVAAIGADSLAEAAGEMAQAVRDLERRAREAEGRTRAALAAEEASAARSPGSERDGGLSYEATQESRDVLERAERLERELTDMVDRAGALEGLSEALLDAGLREEMRRLEALYRRLLESELGERIDALREALRDLRPERLQAALGRLAEDSGRLREDLERSAALLERAGLEQGVKSARNSAEDLARRQDVIAQAFDVDEAWRHEEETLASDAEQLGRSLERLSERLASSLSAGTSAAASDSVRAAGEVVSEAADRARSAAQSAGDESRTPGDSVTGNAAETDASEAAGLLSEAAAMLATADDALGRDWRAEAREVLDHARREAVTLAAEQESLAEGYAGPGALDPATLQGRQAALRSGLDNLFESLAEAGRRTALLDRGSAVAAAEAAEGMDDLLSRLQEGSQRPTRGEATAIAELLNELAARLLASAGAVQAAGSESGTAEMLEQLAQAARMQEGLSREGGSLLFMQEDGRPVGSRLEQLAKEQAEVERGLRELTERAGDQEDLLVRPEALAREAGELARRLESGDLNPETVERQETLFRRLLDAGRSLEREDEEPDRRESRPGTDLPLEVPRLDPAVLAGPRYPHPDEAVLRELPPSYRWMILDYFDRLNRVAEGPEEESP
ncbi:MAG: hypothetical protein P8Y26_03585 [Gemmatimonadales bacterium]